MVISFPYIGITQITNICASDGDHLPHLPKDPATPARPVPISAQWLTGIQTNFQSVNFR